MSSLAVSDPAIVAPERGAVVGKAVVRAARALGLTNATLAPVLGVSEATVSRMAAGAYALVPGSKPYELALLVVRLFRSLDALMGGEEPSMRDWMSSFNLALDGVPGEQVRRVTGLVNAVAYVDSARARI